MLGFPTICQVTLNGGTPPSIVIGTKPRVPACTIVAGLSARTSSRGATGSGRSALATAYGESAPTASNETYAVPGVSNVQTMAPSERLAGTALAAAPPQLVIDENAGGAFT